MNSRLIVLALSALVFATIFVRAADDDSKCRAFVGQDQSIDLAQVGKMRMYGPPSANKSCKDVCASHKYNVGFDYAGKQACCCGQIEE